MASPVLTLRAHEVLCFQGFRGHGYSARFVARMKKVHARLMTNPDLEVRLTTSPDVLCEVCPHHRDDGCTLQGPGHEDHMRAQDEEVLRWLGVEEGAPHPWRDLLLRVGERVRGADLLVICTTCPWLASGWCASGVERLHVASHAPREPGRRGLVR